MGQREFWRSLKNGLQFMTTIEYLNESLEDTLAVTKALTRSAQLSEPPIVTSIRCP